MSQTTPKHRKPTPVQARDVQKRSPDAGEQVHQAAEAGLSGGGGPMPFANRIQESFGGFDVSGVRAHTGGAAQKANEQMGSMGYATGNNVAFRGAPDLFTAAHEAAHVIQQQAGVQLRGGVGEVGDRYEQHADAVAARVVQGKSAEDLLATMAGVANQSSNAVQRRGRAPGSVVQLDAATSYSHEASALPGQTPGQSTAARTQELGDEYDREMQGGASGASTWDQQMTTLRDNMAATYSALEAGFQAYGNALYEAFENQQAVLAEVAAREAQTGALVAAVVSVGMAFVTGGAGALAMGAAARIAGRFTGVAAGATNEFIQNGLVDALKQGINAAGGAVLTYNSNVPATYTASTVRAFRDNGLQAITAENADFLRAIQWLTNNRTALENSFRPVEILNRNRTSWANLQAGARALGATADTRAIERGLWQRWISANGSRVAVRCQTGTDICFERQEFTVPKEVVSHLQTRIGVDEATMRRWAGL